LRDLPDGKEVLTIVQPFQHNTRQADGQTEVNAITISLTNAAAR